MDRYLIRPMPKGRKWLRGETELREVTWEIEEEWLELSREGQLMCLLWRG